MIVRRLLTLSLVTCAATVVAVVAAVSVLGRDAVDEGFRALVFGPEAASDALPPAPPGSLLVITLSDASRPVYGPAASTPADAPFLRLADAAGRRYAPTLGAAARELAVFYADQRRLATSNALGFILESTGATYWGVRQSAVITNATGDAPIEALLAESPEGEVIGIGESVLPEVPPQRIIIALSAKPTLTLDPLRRVFTPGETVEISGTLARGYSAPQALAMSADGRFVDLETTVTDQRFVSRLTVGAGVWVVEILAEGQSGPVPLTQLTLYGDAPVPTVFESTWPPALETATDGAEYIAGLVNGARLDVGLPPLSLSAPLRRVARAHCEDMATTDFVGHRSRRTGTLSDRLRTVGYRSVNRGENVALNRSLYDAHVGLMWSLGHRKNILSPRFTHLGVGVHHTKRGWYVTQVFVRPTPVVDNPQGAARRLLREIDRVRVDDALDATRRDPSLARIAQRAARDATPTPESIVNAVRRAGITAKATVWTARLATLEQFEPPAEVVDAEFAWFGVGVHQDLETEGPSLSVVLIAAGGD